MPFNFNIYSSLLLPFAIQGFLFTLLLWGRGVRETRLSDKLLAALIFLFTLRVVHWMLGFAGWYDSHDAFTTFIFYFPFNHWLWMGPLLYFYFRSLTNLQFRFGRRHLWHFLPGALFVAEYLFFFLADVVVDRSFPFHFGTKGPFLERGLGLLDQVFQVLSYLSVLTYSSITLILFRKYRRYLDDHFSETYSIELAWFRNLLLAIVLGLSISFTYSIGQDLFGLKLSYVQFWYSYFAWGLIIYYLSIQGYFFWAPENLPLQFEPEETAREEEITETTPLPGHYMAEWMSRHRPYLNPELTLGELAVQLDMHPNQLSRIINSRIGKNFNDFVNEYRVDAFKAALADPAKAHLSLLGMALESGFNSKATFNRAFRKHTGLSPSEFAKDQMTREGLKSHS